MTLPNPGVPLSISDIKGEFGGPSNPSLQNYYAGGGYVPAGTVGYYGPIPSSGAISIQDFYGAQAYLASYQLFAGTYQDEYNNLYGYIYSGFSTAPVQVPGVGGLNPATFPPVQNKPIAALNWNGMNNNAVWFSLGTGAVSVPNAGWNTFTVNGYTFSRSTASYFYNPPGHETVWIWYGGPNPFIYNTWQGVYFT